MPEAAELDPDAPPHADAALWPDPEDTERPARHVKGYRRGDVLGWLRRRGNQEISRAHVLAARQFRHHFDVSRYGLSGSGERGLGVRTRPAPRTSPARSDVLRQASMREVGRVYGAVGEAAWPLLLWVVVLDRDVRAWCDDSAARSGVRPDERKAFGRLLAVLDRLAEHFGTHRLVQKEARR